MLQGRRRHVRMHRQEKEKMLREPLMDCCKNARPRPGKRDWRPLRWGMAAALGLLVLYAALMTLTNDLRIAWQEYRRLWLWITLLAVGFGVQAGLYAHARTRARKTGAVGVAASGGVSATSMVACCAHHAADILPILGATALSAFLAQYQEAFLAVGIAANIVGFLVMLRHISKHRLYDSGGVLASLCGNERSVRAAGSVALALLLIITIRGVS